MSAPSLKVVAVPVTADDVSSSTPAVNSMSDNWQLVEDLRSGTSGMRAAGARRMPKFTAEDDESHKARIASATLYPAFSKTVTLLASRPFTRPIAIEGEKDFVDGFMSDVDRQGRNFEHFSSELLELALAYGQCHVLAEYPVRPQGVVTIEQERQAGLRPYFVIVRPDKLLGWRSTDGGLLQQVRFKETVEEPEGEFGVREVEQIRVLEPDKFRVFRKSKTSGKWELFGQPIPNTLGYVPFYTVYAGRTGFMTSRPPLMELAHMNVKHWQSQSDQDTILHVARVPILKVVGVADDFTLTVGTKAAVHLPVGSDMDYVEHSGAAIEAGKVSLDDLKEEMRQAGAEMMVARPGPRTATEVATENIAGLSDLQRIVNNAQDVLNTALMAAADWARKRAPKITLYNEFGSVGTSVETMAEVTAMSSTGIISKRTAFDEAKRRAILSGDVTWEEERARIEDEGSPAGKIDPLTGLPYSQPDDPSLQQE